MAQKSKRTPENQQKLLDVLRQVGNVTTACDAINTSRTQAYAWRKDDEDFAKAWDEAVEEAADRLEQEAWRRAVSGTEKPVYQGGKLVGKIREYSDTLLIFLLKGNRPDKYRERWSGEVTGANGGPIQIIPAVPRPGDKT